MTEPGEPHATGEERAEVDREGGADAGSDREPDDGDEPSHLDDVEDGAGCTEIWERLSERREE
ncbi:hypothetical protein [Halorubrum tebenquichense]|uniref:Uncharacterized protein n=1 Tax=Halorubrum tebenquichense DSM 14210 TaxID=1227485 RepID=M0DZN4_9EURY|nr:hypothetical protein [Halorubrum tebenquichense]ELZ39539.1 hypothetical protein C472_04473 [Halorubrum tebenquichense DSM 14210]